MQAGALSDNDSRSQHVHPDWIRNDLDRVRPLLRTTIITLSHRRVCVMLLSARLRNESSIFTEHRLVSTWQITTRDDNGSHFLTRDPHDPWPVTRDYSRVMTPDYCSFQSGPLSGSALKIKHHHCHKIIRRDNWIKLTLWLMLCRKSLQCLKKTKSFVNGSRVLTRDPRDPLRFVDPLDP